MPTDPMREQRKEAAMFADLMPQRPNNVRDVAFDFCLFDRSAIDE